MRTQSFKKEEVEGQHGLLASSIYIDHVGKTDGVDGTAEGLFQGFPGIVENL